jgi:hypothetical protein
LLVSCNERKEIILKRAKLTWLALGALTVFSGMKAQAQSRTVIDTELGGFFTSISGVPMKDWGLYLQVSSNYTGAQLAPQAIKVKYSRFEAFAPSDSAAWPFFPYAQLRSYEASEVAAGRPPIFMTATYQGKKRPLLFSWDLKLVNNKPTANPSTWHYAVNVADDRFVKFWLQQYLRAILWKQVDSTSNVWFGLDETAVTPGVFGVLDDNNNFVTNVQWDQPFPQGGAAWMSAIKTFFDRIHQYAPDVFLIPNVGAFYDQSQFSNVLANVPGIAYENFWDGPAPVAYTRNSRVAMFSNVSAWGVAGKIGLLRMWVANGSSTQLLSAFSLYSLVKGNNFFFDPMYTGSMNGVPPSEYQGWQARLGNPVGPYTSQAQSGQRAGYNLYSRVYDGGIVYLNWTGITKTVMLPTGTKYYDANGNQVTQISLPDGVGTFASTSKAKVAKPQISPRYGSAVSGPVSVTISCDTPNATIRYTTNGSDPSSSSPVYGGPFELSGAATVNAAAFLNGYAQSALSTASYRVQFGLPSVQIANPSDTGIAGSASPVLVLSAVSSESVSVTYVVHHSNGATSTGTATILPGDKYGHFSVAASGSSGSVTQVTLTGATQATLGQTIVYSFKAN